MIADYRERGIDKWCKYIAMNTDDHEKAVRVLADAMQRKGLDVSCITVCPGAKNFDDLQRIADEGIKPGNVYIPYIFDGGTGCG